MTTDGVADVQLATPVDLDLAVYPATIPMAVDAGPPTDARAALAWLRLPMQFPMIAWAVGHARG